MKQIFRVTLASGIGLLLHACAGLQQMGSQMGTGLRPLSEAEIASGLREALEVGISKGVEELMKENGYYGNTLIRILLPPEARQVENIITQHIPNGQQLIQEVIVRMNRTAEEAAREAKPIFVDAIRAMSINDARNILFGNNDAATQYLRQATYQRLFNAYYPKIQQAMQKIAVQQAWYALANPYNQLASSPLGPTLGARQPLPEDISNYITERALYGLFFKVAEEELNIRQKVSARITPLLQRVFGELDKNR